MMDAANDGTPPMMDAANDVDAANDGTPPIAANDVDAANDGTPPMMDAANDGRRQ